MTGKTQGSHSTTYAYRYGDKRGNSGLYPPESSKGWGLSQEFRRVSGDLASMTYNYDGLGKRRKELTLFSGQPVQTTWFRWTGWEESGEYASTPDGLHPSTLQTGYVPGLAAFAGSNPATADWRCAWNENSWYSPNPSRTQGGTVPSFRGQPAADARTR